jgi:type IV pilus assembly protein PilX
MKPSSSNRQLGAALIVSMVLLVAITLLGVFVMSGSRLEWLMASNSRFQRDAEMRAEAALPEGEETIKNLSPSITWDSTPGFYNSPTLVNSKDPRKVSNWSNLSTINTTAITPAQYIVEKLDQSCLDKSSPGDIIVCSSPPGSIYLRIYTYRVWALALDGKGTARITQSTYRRIDNPNADLTIGSNTLISGYQNYRRIGYAVINDD